MRPSVFARLSLIPRASIHQLAIDRFGSLYAGQNALRQLDGSTTPAVYYSRNQASSRFFGTRRKNSSADVMGDKLPHKAYVALGSNLGNRIEMIESACKMMEADKSIRISRTSSLYETEPMYVKEQDRFINGICEVRLIMFVMYSRNLTIIRIHHLLYVMLIVVDTYSIGA